MFKYLGLVIIRIGFDSVGLQYYDEKNWKVLFIVHDYPQGWRVNANEVDNEWIFLKEIIKEKA